MKSIRKRIYNIVLQVKLAVAANKVINAGADPKTIKELFLKTYKTLKK